MKPLFPPLETLLRACLCVCVRVCVCVCEGAEIGWLASVAKRGEERE